MGKFRFSVLAMGLALSACGSDLQLDNIFPKKDIPPAPANIGKCNDPITVAIVHSVRHNPNEWETNTYSFTNGKISVWVGNEDYGISVAPGDEAKTDQYSTMSGECKILLYRTYQSYLSKIILDEV